MFTFPHSLNEIKPRRVNSLFQVPGHEVRRKILGVPGVLHHYQDRVVGPDEVVEVLEALRVRVVAPDEEEEELAQLLAGTALGDREGDVS